MKHFYDTGSRFDFRPGDSPYPENERFIPKGLTRRIFGMWIDYGIKLVRTKCIQFQDASVSIEASHAPNQISPASNQTFAVYIGPVIIDRSLMAKIYKNLVEHPRDSKLNIDPANKFSYSSIHVSYNQHRMKSFRDIIPKILRKLL